VLQIRFCKLVPVSCYGCNGNVDECLPVYNQITQVVLLHPEIFFALDGSFAVQPLRDVMVPLLLMQCSHVAEYLGIFSLTM
jgi:hypothetical protein